jgi:nucleotide-binding universal stress UspA family protein
VIAMPTFVVPMDGSSFAERALRPAASLAARHDSGSDPGRLLLLGCSWPQDPPIEARLEDRAELLRGVVDVEVRILEGVDPAEGILSTLAAGDDHVLCMATHGRGGVRAALLGSTAEAVLCRVTEPVVLVGPAVGSTVLAGEHGRLLACSDGSPFADEIAPVASAWATTQAMDPWLVEVIQPDEGVHAPGEPPVVELRQAAEARLADLAARVDGHPTVRTRVLHGAPASRSIRLFAEDLPASLIAMATHGRTGLARSALGSVAADVTRTAPCPVLLHRSAPEPR